jgi:hypothetical protein
LWRLGWQALQGKREADAGAAEQPEASR